MKHKSERPRDPRELNPQISAALSRLILRCLEKDKEKRYQSAAELSAEIKTLEGLPTAERMKPRRTPVPSREITVTFRLRKLLIPALAVVVLAVLGLVLSRILLKPKAVERSVAVVNFQNQTGDAAYDYLRSAIPNLLITSLEQSKYLQVTTFERLHDLLRQSGKPEAETIDGDLGFELCQKDNVEALVLGSFVKMGETFATDVKIFDVKTRRLMKSFTAQGTGAQSILEKQIAQLSREISRGVGLSKRAVDETAPQMAQAPTRSMEAYKYYLEGRDKWQKKYFEEARKDLQKAVELDPECGIAYIYLGGIRLSSGDMPGAAEMVKKAYEFSSKAAEKDRLLIESQYALRVEQDEEKLARILQEIASRFPKEKDVYSYLTEYYTRKGMFKEAAAAAEKGLALDPNWLPLLNQLAYAYLESGDTAKAEATFKRVVAAAPQEANPLDSLGEFYSRTGRFDEAIESYKGAIKLKPDFGCEEGIAYIFAVRGDYAEALGWIDQFILMAPNNDSKGRGYWWKAIYDHLSGRRGQARKEMERFMTFAESFGNKYSARLARAGQAFLAFDGGKYDEALRDIADAHQIAVGAAKAMAASGAKSATPSFDSLASFERDLMAGWAAVRRGQKAEASQRVDAILAAFPESRPPKAARGPELKQSFQRLQAEVLLLDGKPAEAIGFMEKNFTLTIPSFRPPIYPFNYLFLNFPLDQDVVPRAYEKMGDVDRAIEAYQRLLTFDPQGKDRRLHNPIYHYRLAKLYDAKGLKGQAETEYRKFLEHWKDADPGIPELVDAKKRLG